MIDNMSKDKEKMTKLVEEYEGIKIPRELESIVKSSIATAKEDVEREKTEEGECNKMDAHTNKTKKKKKGGIRYMIRTAQIAAAAFLVIIIAANSSASIAHAMESIPLLGTITRVVTFRTYAVDNGNTQANIETPVIESVTLEGEEVVELVEATEQLNRSVEEYTNELIAEFEADIAKMEADGLEGYESVNTTYTIVTDTDTLFSLRMDTTVSMGGSVNFTMIYHIDKVSNQVITLEDIFEEESDYITIVSELVIESMRSNMAEDESLLYFIDSEDGFSEFDFQQIKADQNFYFDENGNLVLVFDEYEAAPGYMGIVEITIDNEVLKDSLKSQYLAN